MSARALLNRVQFLKAEGLSDEARDLLRWHLRDPSGFSRAHAQQTSDARAVALLEAGGEIG